MKEETLENLQSQVEDVLNMNMSFYRESPDDEKLHFIDPGVGTELAFYIIQYIAAIFGIIQGGIAAGRWLSGRLSKKTKIPEIDREKLDSQIETLKENMNDENLRTEIKNDIKKILKYHGWPANEADSDAQKLLKTVSE